MSRCKKSNSGAFRIGYEVFERNIDLRTRRSIENEVKQRRVRANVQTSPCELWT
jgi:hypothetical protein